MLDQKLGTGPMHTPVAIRAKAHNKIEMDLQGKYIRLTAAMEVYRFH